MRNTNLKLSILAAVAVAALAIVPAASADSFNIVVNGTVVGTATLTSGAGTCGTFSTDASDACLIVSMSSGNTLRVGGDVIGLSGSVATGTDTGIDLDSSGLLSIVTHPCNSSLGGSVGICITAGSGADISTLTLVVDGTNVDIEGFHVASAACGSSGTCFATVVPQTSTIPEPGTLSLLGTGLVGLAGLVRRRLAK